MGVVITGSGSYIPEIITKNDDFLDHDFYDADGVKLAQENTIIVEKFKAITGIAERRYAPSNLTASDLGFRAAEKAIADAGIDKETLDYIIFAHNFGDVKHSGVQSDMLPSLATRVKHLLEIKNPYCVAYDTIFGCPGWIEGMIQANAFIKSGMAKKCMVIGGETLSRVIDANDRDSMIFADGAGATIIEKTESNNGIITHKSATFANGEAKYLFFAEGYTAKATENNTHYIKMHGRKIYEFACINVPQAMKTCLDSADIGIEEVKKIFIHQANEKMDEAIIKRFYKLYKKPVPEHIMPMNIHKHGNSSVATIPTLFDMVKKGVLENHSLHKGDILLFASVGAGMNINALAYRY